MARISRKELKRDEFIEATKDAENWLEENWRLVLQIVGVVVVVAIVVGGWFWYAKASQAKAATLLAGAMKTYQAAETGGFVDTAALESALKEFETASGKGGRAPVGLVAEYYRGVTLHRLGRDDEAIVALEKVADHSGASASLSGAASAVLAEVYAARGEQERAIAVLQGLIDAETPTYPVDQALLEMADLHEAAGDRALAKEIWQRVVDEFPAGGAAIEARERLGT